MKKTLNKEELWKYINTLHAESKELPRETIADLALRLGHLEVIQKLQEFAEEYI